MPPFGDLSLIPRNTKIKESICASHGVNGLLFFAVCPVVPYLAWRSFCVLRGRRAARRPRPIGVAVDGREVSRGIIHTHVSFPVTPGPLTLVYPKWIPGAHGPVGPIVNLVGLKLTAGGNAVAWKPRDDVDMFAFHCEVPAGASTLEAVFDFVSPPPSNTLTVITCNKLVLYPQGKASDDVTFAARLQLPAGWKFGTALPVTAESAEGIVFKPVSLTTLVDSPVLSGAHFREIPLNVGQVPTHFIDMASDSDAALDMKPEQVEQYQKLVDEAGA